MTALIQKDSCYFSHDANAKDDYKCMLLIDQLGLEGYGIFWVLVETLREQKNYKYPLRLVPSLARKYNTTQAKMETVIKAYGLFSIDKIDKKSFFFSGSLNRRMQVFEHKKLQQIEAGKKGVEAKKAKAQKQIEELSGNDSTNRPSTDPQANKEKEIKLKEIEEERRRRKEDFENFYNWLPKNGIKMQAWHKQKIYENLLNRDEKTLNNFQRFLSEKKEPTAPTINVQEQFQLLCLHLSEKTATQIEELEKSKNWKKVFAPQTLNFIEKQGLAIVCDTLANQSYHDWVKNELEKEYTQK